MLEAKAYFSLRWYFFIKKYFHVHPNDAQMQAINPEVQAINRPTP
jgi:hypothetical protein